MATKILIKRSTTTGEVPTTGDIDIGELAINTVDKRIFTNNSGTIVELGTTPSVLDVTGNADIGGTFDVVGQVTVDDFTATGTVNLTAATTTVATPTADAHAATKLYVDTAVNDILDGAPAALDTLNEIAAAINDDANVYTTLTNSIATKLPLAGGTMTGSIDMGVNKVTSSTTPTADSDLTRKAYVDDLYQSTVDAETSAANALASEQAAATSASSASSSASTASSQASAASTSASNASSSATAASNSATSASNSATASATSATASASSATAASDSADDAEASATAAASSATDAANSATDAANALGTKVSKSGDTMTGDLNFGDNDKAVFGAGSDLQIYHDGSNSYVDDAGSGVLFVRGNSQVIIGKYTGERMLEGNADGSVYAFYDNSAKLATTSTGVDVTGTVTADGLDISTLSGDATVYLQNVASARGMKITKNYDDFSANVFYSLHPTTEAGSLAFKGSQDSTQLFINSNGDISFYEDTGTTPKFFWDASAEKLGIGTSSPASKLSVSGGASGVATDIDYSGGIATGAEYSALRFTASGQGFVPAEIRGVNTNGGQNLGVMQMFTSGTERMRIDSSGNVGIGTSSPASKLHVADGNITVGSSTNTSSTNTLLAGYGYNIGATTYGNTSIRSTYNNGDNSASLEFYTASSGLNTAERMRIDSSGNLLVGGTSVESGFSGIPVLSVGANSNGIITCRRNVTSGATQVVFFNPNGIVGQILTDGSSTSYVTSSDYRLKEDWQPMVSNFDRVLALKPVNFAWKLDGKRVDGFLAHELAEVVPEAVTGTKDAMRTEEYEVTPAVLDDDGNVVTEAVMGTRSVPDYQGIDQSKLVPLLTAALQEALTKIESLETRIDALEGN